jgi:NarL family two-component system response regulator LiaR
MNNIKVLIIDDNEEAFAKHIINLLKEEKDINICVAMREESIQVVEEQNIDIILMNINIDKTKRMIDFINYIKMKNIKLIMLTDYNNKEIIINNKNENKKVKKLNYNHIPLIIRRIYNNDSSSLMFLKDHFSMIRQQIVDNLTLSERNIFNLIEKGYNRTEMQKVLDKSDNTIKSQIRNILKKFDVNNCNEVINKVKVIDFINV